MREFLNLIIFKKIINIYFNKKTSFLLSVSGGLDSMVLLKLFYLSNLNFEVAHVNYGLRGASSDDDQKLIENICKLHKIKIHIKKENIKLNQHSIQIIAREMRYNFLKKIASKQFLSIIVTGHHQDDQIETFFINLFRGSGLKGLSSMKILQKNLFRPLLSFSKLSLLQFAINQNISWREDISNQENIYLRNKIRNQLIPILETFDSNVKKSISHSIKIIEDQKNILYNEFIKIEKKIFIQYNVNYKSYFYLLKKTKQLPLTFLYMLFSKFEYVSLEEILKFLNSRVGTKLSNKKYIFWLDYKYLIIELIQNIKFKEILIYSYNFVIYSPIKIFGKLSKSINNSANSWIDIDKFQLPLKIRKWNSNDYIYPINMIGKKKVSKFLKDKKISKFFKNKIYVLLDKTDQILWIIGMRADDRFKVDSTTKTILNLWINYC